MKKQVAILGAGPAGLLAALAVEQSGMEPRIYSRIEKSQMFGAMYLHRHIEGLNAPAPDFHLDVIKTGTREGYAYNVYGDKDAPCSWDDIETGRTEAWSLSKAYDRLWRRYLTEIVDSIVAPSNMGVICHNWETVLCTIPALRLCCDWANHYFMKQDIWVKHGAMDRTYSTHSSDVMYYNGYPSDGRVEGMIGFPWYRYSSIGGYQAWEYSREDRVEEHPDLQVSKGMKPIRTNCDCWKEYPSFHRLGRFGRWEKGVLTHHAYEQALEICNAL